MHPHDKRLQFIELRSKGWSIYRISEAIDVPKSTLCDWQKQDKARIDELKEMEQEALEEQLTEQREHEYQKLSSRLDLVERALDQQLQEKIATLSIMELCRLSSAFRSQLGKLERRTKPAAPCNEEFLLVARRQRGSLPLAGRDQAQQQRTQQKEPLQTNKMVLFGTNLPENGTAPQPTKPSERPPAINAPTTTPSPACEAAECLSTLNSQPSTNFETGHFRTVPSIPDVRKDSDAPEPTVTMQMEAPSSPPEAPGAPMLTVTLSETQPEPPAAVPMSVIQTTEPLPTPPIIPERMIGGIIDPKRIIGRRCSQPSTPAHRQTS